MKIATYNVNGVNGRLEVLLRWLDEAKPDVVVLQELTPPCRPMHRRSQTNGAEAIASVSNATLFN